MNKKEEKEKRMEYISKLTDEYIKKIKNIPGTNIFLLVTDEKTDQCLAEVPSEEEERRFIKDFTYFLISQPELKKLVSLSMSIVELGTSKYRDKAIPTVKSILKIIQK